MNQFMRDFGAFLFGLVGASFTLGLALSGAFDWTGECITLAVCCGFTAIACIAWLAIAEGGYAECDRLEQLRKAERDEIRKVRREARAKALAGKKNQ